MSKTTRPTLVWVTNIPTPYRNHRYRLFTELFPPRGIDFVVYYMARSERGRFWPVAQNEMDHPHRIFRGLHIVARGVTYHFNAGLVWRLVRRPPDILVLGGYSAPTVWVLAWLLRKRSLLLLGSETNDDDGGARTGIRFVIKRWIVSRVDGYVGPGARSREHLRGIAKSASTKPFIRLPNLVDGHVYGVAAGFGDEVRSRLRTELDVPSEEQLWVVPARLELFKGVQGFLCMLSGIQGVRVLIAGEGSQRAHVEEMIKREDLPVRLLGHVNEARMVELYAAADLFVLPSLRDPSPLTAIEALAAGLPLLLSVRAGNFEEVVHEPNGWAFDPDDADGMRRLVRDIANLSRSELVTMGRASRELYLSEFDSQKWVELVADELAALKRDSNAGLHGPLARTKPGR